MFKAENEVFNGEYVVFNAKYELGKKTTVVPADPDDVS